MVIGFYNYWFYCTDRTKIYQKLRRKLTGLLLLTWIGGILRYALLRFKLGIELIMFIFLSDTLVAYFRYAKETSKFWGYILCVKSFLSCALLLSLKVSTFGVMYWKLRVALCFM